MRTPIAACLFAVILFGCGAPTVPTKGAAEPSRDDIAAREYLCLTADSPPQLDGALDDGCWRRARPSPVFHTIGACPEEVPRRMAIRFLCDKDNLYVAVDAASRPGVVPAARQERRHDDPVFNDDSVELFLHTSPSAKDYYHFMLNCDNAILDAHVIPDRTTGHAKWDPEWRHETKKRPGGWTAEMVIPFRAFDQKAPPQGFVWLVRVGSNAPGFPHAMWPRNPTASFHDPTCSGYLIFGDRNLLTNGGFEGPVSDKGIPQGWAFCYNEKEGKGVIALSESNAPEGKRCIRYEKTTPEMWFPQLHANPFPIQPHSMYEFSALVSSDKAFVMRHSLHDASGNRVKKYSMGQPPTKGYERREIRFRVEADGAQMSVGIQLSQVSGVVWVDDVRVQRVNGLEFRRGREVEPHRYHRLERLAARAPFKPCSHVSRGDMIQSERVIFRDTGTGAQIWRLTDTPGGSNRHFYMEVPPWNCDGSKIVLCSSEWGQRFNALLPADGSAMRRLPIKASCYTWDRRDPDRIYYCKGVEGGKTSAVCYSLKDDKEIVLRTFDGATNVWPISQDNKYLLVRESFPKAPWQAKSKIHLLSLDGKEDIILDPKGQIHQLWFTKLPDHSVEFEYEHGGYKPGEYPEGNFMMKKDGSIKRIFGGEGQWAGHRAHSPSGKLMCPGGRLQVVNKLTGDITPLAPIGGNHQSWEADESWLAASSDPHLIRFAADGRGFVHRIGSHNSAIGHSTYWTEAHPAMSPDGTKLGYASSMLGDIDFYFMVMMLPGRPEELKAASANGRVELTWEPPTHSKEIRGYLVYRSDKSGEPFEQISPTEIKETRFVDAPPAGRPFYYTVASLERCGLESLKSDEVCSDPAWPGGIRRVFECEFAPVTGPPAMEEFDTAASGLYGMNLGRDEPAKDFSMPFNVPRDGEYSLWLRVKSPDNGFTLTAGVDGQLPKAHSGEEGGWRWIRIAEGLHLARGAHRVALAPSVPYVSIDQLVVTDNPDLQPSGAEGADITPPPAPNGMTADALAPYSIRLRWQPVYCRDFHHYNLYLADSSDCQAKQENLIASPAAASHVAWGLAAGKTYSCCATSVDRAGNESRPSAVATVSTPPIRDRLFARFDATWRPKAVGQTEVAFESPSDADIVVWTKWQSFDSTSHGTGGELALAIDGKPLGRHQIRFGYLCVGHGGPVPGDWLWNFSAPLAGDPGQERFGFRIGKGRHTLTLSAASDADIECGGIIVTNDFGFLPGGAFTSFLPMKGATSRK
ncbi:MAG: sugar-binding protein [Planctomycetota bacterium]